MSIKYTKKTLTTDEQIGLLKSRGLIIDNEDIARSKLDQIGYYHLSAYFKSFQNTETDKFKDQYSFQQVLSLYSLDRKIKLHCFDAIERVELALKSFLTNEMSSDFGVFWYRSKDLFLDKFDHQKEFNKIQKIIDERKNKDGIIKDYYKKYSAENFLPSWIFMESLTFGATIKIFKNLKIEHRKKIAKKFNLNEKILTSWLVLLLDVRNICAHHERLWNKDLKKIIIPKNSAKFCEKGKIWNVFMILVHFLKILSPTTQTVETIKKLLEDFFADFSVNKNTMGFCDDWQNHLTLKKND